ncbi:hypothetical protein [Croceicoccus mobilis]|uniref:ATPase n=1 Tax=Croceicoccus mobilis TaxID=1703339 RepID=A0A916Z6E2_9SPHN|nr:hypothetical protein [Croceicoccus mobilis]GGD76358.1 hypothetical protein GCM10010990_27520 [Croceicoccus mobilis]
MERRRNIIRFGQDGEPVEQHDETQDSAQYGAQYGAQGHEPDAPSHYELSDEMAYEDMPQSRRGWVVPGLAITALAGWTGFFAWANFYDGTALSLPAGPAEWAALIGQWSMPAALIIALWMLALRHSRAEAGRFADAAASLRNESIALEDRLSKVNAELSIAREFLTSQGRDLESLGRVASERLSENAGRLQELIGHNGEQVDRLHGVSSAALDNMEKIRGQLPVVTNAARDLVNSIGRAGDGAQTQIERLREGFGRIGEAGEMSTLKVDEMRARVNEALTEFERCADQLGTIASDRFAALDAEGEALRERLDQQEIEALAAVRDRAEEVERMLESSRAKMADAENFAINAMRDRLAKLEDESGDIAGRVARGEADALLSLRTNLAALGDEAERVFAAFGTSGDSALAGWRDRLSAANDEADSLMTRFTEIGGDAVTGWRERMSESGREAASMFSGLDRKSEETLETVGSRVATLSMEIGRLHGELLQHGENLESEIAERIERSETAARTLGERLSAGLEALDGEIDQRRQKNEAAGRALTESLAAQLDEVDDRIAQRRQAYLDIEREFGEKVAQQFAAIEEAFEERRIRQLAAGRELNEAVAEQLDAIDRSFDERRAARIAAGEQTVSDIDERLARFDREIEDRTAARIAAGEKAVSDVDDRLSHIDRAIAERAAARIAAGEQIVSEVDERIAAIDRAMDERAAARIALGQEGIAALATQLEEIDADLDERRRRQQATSESLARHAEIISGRVADYAKKMEEVADSGRDAEAMVGASLAALSAKLTESRDALSGTDKAVLALTDSSVRLLELIEASSRHTREALPEAIGEAEGKLTAVTERMDRLGDAMREAGENSKSLDEAVEAARSTTRGTLEDIVALHDTLKARGSEHAEQIGSLREVLAQARNDSEAMAEAAEATLGGAIAKLAEASREAVANIEGTSSDAVRAIAEKLATESGTVVREAVEASTRETLENLDAAVSRATGAARDAAGELEDHLNKVNEITGHLEYRIAEARRRAEEDIDDHFARRVAQITESLNSTAIDIDKVLSAEVSDSAWQAYLKGERGIFTRRAVRLVDNSDARTIVDHYEADGEFREHVNRYIHDFEAMLRNLLATREGNTLAVTMLSSDMGKLYVAMAQSIERLRR